MKKASFTVEAVFIMPILLGIVFMLMYVMFLLHDRVVLQGNFLYALSKVAENKREQENLEQMLSKALWSAKIEQVNINRTSKKVSGEVRGKLRLNIPVMSFFIKEIQYISCTGEYYYIQPEQTRWMKKISRSEQ